jgi:hypothetical protein
LLALETSNDEQARARVGAGVMITVGSVSREEAARRFPFLSPHARGRRRALREFTHRDPEFVFWISPEGVLHDARDSHRANPPKGFAHIVDDKPDYGGFLRGRVARLDRHQLIVLYCRSEALSERGPAVKQLLTGIAGMPSPIDDGALVVSDNGDVYGTVADLTERTANPFRAPCPKCGSVHAIPILYGKTSLEMLEMAKRGEVDLGGCIVHSNAPAWKCLGCGERHGTNEWLESLRRFERTPEEAAAQQADYERRKAEKNERQRVLKARLRDPRRP